MATLFDNLKNIFDGATALVNEHQADAMKLFGLVEMVLFIATVFIAYTYVWRRGGLDWD